jgi:diacylglycerol kinase
VICCAFIAALLGLILRPLLPERRSPLSWRRTDAPATRSGRVQSFRYAFAGLGFVVRNEPNMRIHLAAAMAALALGWILQIDTAEWRWLILAIGLVMGAETLNSAVEQACNAITLSHHPAIKVAKDAAAGAVLLAAATAVLIGISVFVPHLAGWSDWPAVCTN